MCCRQANLWQAGEVVLPTVCGFFLGCDSATPRRSSSLGRPPGAKLCFESRPRREAELRGTAFPSGAWGRAFHEAFTSLPSMPPARKAVRLLAGAAGCMPRGRTGLVSGHRPAGRGRSMGAAEGARPTLGAGRSCAAGIGAAQPPNKAGQSGPGLYLAALSALAIVSPSV